jgi:hypothetical protein
MIWLATPCVENTMNPVHLLGESSSFSLRCQSSLFLSLSPYIDLSTPECIAKTVFSYNLVRVPSTQKQHALLNSSTNAEEKHVRAQPVREGGRGRRFRFSEQTNPPRWVFQSVDLQSCLEMVRRNPRMTFNDMDS